MSSIDATLRGMAREIGGLTAEIKDLRRELNATCARMNGYSDRIRALEGWRYLILGGAAVISVLASVAARWLP